MQSTTIDQYNLPSDIGAEYILYCRRRMLEEYLPQIKRCLNQLSDDDVWWRAHETNNSIDNIILHLNGNIRQWIVSGVGGVSYERDRAREFAERGPIPRPELMKRFEETLREADRALEHFDVKKLLEVRHIQVFDVTCPDASTWRCTRDRSSISASCGRERIWSSITFNGMTSSRTDTAL